MFAAAVAKLTNSIFPIYRTTGLAIQVTASGFFVDAYGTFVTVAHAFDDAPPGAQFQYRGRSPDNVQNPSLPITEIARDNAQDILIGRVNLQLTHGLDILETEAPLGSSICVAGYPLAQLGLRPNGDLDVSRVRRYFQSAMVLDRVACSVESGRTHKGFTMTEFALFGMSGGPVVTTDGAVVGMQASIMAPRTSVGAGGRQITIENACAIGSEHIHALLQQTAPQQQPAIAALIA
jgi:S1-C subfamily serine protease